MLENKKVIVIGGGIAGVVAARDLALAGYGVTLLEARDRLGGRIYTDFGDLSVPLELGAEFIHGKPQEMFSTLEEARLLFCDVPERHWFLENGTLSKTGEFWHDVNELMSKMKITAPDQSFREFLAAVPDEDASQKIKAMARMYVEGFHAANIDRIGVHGLIKATSAEEEIDGDQSFRVLSGYDAVVRFLCGEAERAGATIYLKTIVKEISWRANRVEVVGICGDETRDFAAAAAVVTLPLGVLQAPPESPTGLKFVPELPREKLTAISAIEMGHVVKLMLRFRTRFWEKLELNGENLWPLGFVHYPEAPFPTWWTLLPIRAPILVAWVGGTNAESLLQNEQPFILNEGLSSLSRILNVSYQDLQTELEAAQFHNWSADPFSRGAYAYLPVDGLMHQENLSTPVDGTLFFAGEATSRGHIGTVHGALMSGRRAATEIIELGG
jgi:monoamine oxidase